MFRSPTIIPFLTLLAVAATVFSFDMYIPSLPLMAEEFHCSRELIQFSLTAGIAGSSIFTLIVGPLSDSFGRRKILVFSQLIFSLGGIIAAFSTEAEFLIAARFLQGSGGAAASVLSFAILRDVFDFKQSAIYMAYLSTTITVSLVIAPLLGGFIADYSFWQVNFIFLGVFGLVATSLLFLGLPETLKKKIPFSIFESLKIYGRALRNLDFVLMALLPSLLIGGFVGFITTVAFYFIKELHMSPGTYGLYQGGVMFFNALFSYFSGHAIRSWGSKNTATVGVGLSVIGGVGFYLISMLGFNNPVLMSAIFSIYGAGLGFAFAAITSENMSLFSENVGAISAMIGFIRGFIISSCVSISAFLYNGKIESIGLFILGVTLIGCSIYFRVHRRIQQNEIEREYL